MKILVISNMYPSRKDPVYGTFVESFVNQLTSLNGEKDTKTVVLKGRSSNSLCKYGKYLIFYIRIIINLIINNYDLIYVHTITYPIPPIRIARLFKILPLVFNVHGGDVITRSKTATKLKHKSIPLLREAKLIVSPSFYFKEILLKEFDFLCEEKIFVSPSGGIDSSFYNSSISKKQDNTFTVGYVSRIDEAKGWDIFIKAVSILIKNNIGVKAIIAGRGNQTSIMNKMIAELSLNDYIEYIGPIPYNNLPQVYSLLDLFVFPTELNESLGLVGLEAMACKVPVIGSNIGGLKDYIIPNYNGFFFNVGNYNDLANKIITYISLSTEEKKIIENNAYKTALTYSSEKTKYDLYSKLNHII